MNGKTPMALQLLRLTNDIKKQVEIRGKMSDLVLVKDERDHYYDIMDIKELHNEGGQIYVISMERPL